MRAPFDSRVRPAGQQYDLGRVRGLACCPASLALRCLAGPHPAAAQPFEGLRWVSKDWLSVGGSPLAPFGLSGTNPGAPGRDALGLVVHRKRRPSPLASRAGPQGLALHPDSTAALADCGLCSAGLSCSRLGRAGGLAVSWSRCFVPQVWVSRALLASCCAPVVTDETANAVALLH